MNQYEPITYMLQSSGIYNTAESLKPLAAVRIYGGNNASNRKEDALFLTSTMKLPDVTAQTNLIMK